MDCPWQIEYKVQHLDKKHGGIFLVKCKLHNTYALR